ncbi:oxidoreductase, FAD/FMN-binding protein [Ancylostoma caninum]|uniref:Oxidoreductase, FAD/FMN-binding protein n=1 Tax=Ancylostoma caninum TaxID=29170 RepID=A0A368GBB6_ANCCA|nr:oxidoreductase, FAD/FMN-binding protein [Ancylostoma caninum]
MIICRENDSPELRNAFTELAGRQTPIGVNERPYSCSDVQLVSDIIKAGKPIPLALDQIKPEVIDRFVYAAKFAYETGFDGIQLHAAHGYLLSQFLSPTTNKRTDRYGGSLRNRTRVIVEIYEAIRKEIPAATGFIVGIKINSVEFQSEGLTVDDAKEACSIVEECGFDFVELSGGTMEKTLFHHERESTRRREAFFIEFAEKIRPVFIETVVYVTGGFRTAKGMVDAIRSGATDGIGLGRPITAEPDLPRKILIGTCFSAPDTKINPDDFMMTFFVSSAQMGQMGRLPASKLKNVCEGIADLSMKDEAEHFKKHVASYIEGVKKLVEANEPVPGVFQHKSLH